MEHHQGNQEGSPREDAGHRPETAEEHCLVEVDKCKWDSKDYICEVCGCEVEYQVELGERAGSEEDIKGI